MMKPDQAEGLRKLVQQNQLIVPNSLRANGQAKPLLS